MSDPVDLTDAERLAGARFVTGQDGVSLLVPPGGYRVFEPPPRATLVMPPSPSHGPLVSPVDWCAGDRAIAQYFWTSTGKDEDAWTCSEADVRRVISFGMKAQPVPHGTPYGHGELTVLVDRIPMPIMVQMLRHRVQQIIEGMDGTEVAAEIDWAPNISQKSYRYVSATGKSIEQVFQVPTLDEMVRQVGRPGRYTYEPLSLEDAQRCMDIFMSLYEHSWRAYSQVNKIGLANERARFLLAQGALTRLYATASYRNWFNWLVQRHDAHAQWEMQQVATQVEPLMAQLAPLTYELWVESGRRII